PAASAWRDSRRHHDRHHLRGRRDGADHHQAALRGGGHLPGDDAVPDPRKRYPGALSYQGRPPRRGARMSLDLVIAIIVTIAAAATPILLAALGELVVEKSGVLNLGVEGMMLIGAVITVAVTLGTGNHLLAIVCAALAAAAAAMIFGVLTLTLSANQVATGLALTIFGTG